MFVSTLGQVGQYLGCPIHGDASTPIQSVCFDSRQVSEKCLYIPLVGQRADGHDFVASIQKSIEATLWQKDHGPAPDCPHILVDSTYEACQALAKAYARDLDCTYIGVTGSNGKTSTKDMLLAVLQTRYKTQATAGNQNNELGLPMTLLNLSRDTEVAILEMGMENPGDIDFLASFVPLSVGIITSIGQAHLASMGSMDGIIAGKLEILDHIQPGGIFLYPTDSEALVEKMAKDRPITYIGFGQKDLEKVSTDQLGTNFMVGGFPAIHLNVVGRFQAVNALAVMHVARALGIKDEQMVASLASVQLTAMRSNIETIHQATIINDTYKSNPESAKQALETLASMPGEHIAVLSDMLDLGVDQEALHASVGQKAQELGIELYCTGPLSKAYGGRWFENKQDLIEALRPRLESQVTILVKGSRMMKMEEVIEAWKGRG